MSPAFAATTAVLPRASLSTSTSTSTFAPRPSAAVAKRSLAGTPTMVLPINNKKANKSIPQGFTEFSETLNSRAAMVGFVAALGAEILNPAHPTMVQQVTSIFTTVQHLF